MCPKVDLWGTSDNLDHWHQGDPSDINQEDMLISKLGHVLWDHPCVFPIPFALKNEDNLISLSSGLFASYQKTEHLLKFSVLPISYWPQFAQEMSQDWLPLGIMWEVASRKENKAKTDPLCWQGWNDAATQWHQAIYMFFLIFKPAHELKSEANEINPLSWISIEFQSRPSPMVIRSGCE